MAELTAEEMQTVTDAFYGSVLGLMAAEPGGFEQEFPKLIGALHEMRSKYPNNALIQALLATEPEHQKARMVSELQQSKEALRTTALETSRKAVSLLDSKVDAEEAGQYKQAVYEVVDQVADAAGEMGFVGSDGVQIGDEEAAFLSDLKTTLGLGA